MDLLVDQVMQLQDVLEADRDRAGEGLAELKIGPEHRLEVVDGILSGTHEPGSSHFSLLSAFAAEPVRVGGGS